MAESGGARGGGARQSGGMAHMQLGDKSVPENMLIPALCEPQIGCATHISQEGQIKR